MSCGPDNPTFRLLDSYVGWDPDDADGALNLAGLDDPAGVCLALKDPDEITASDLLAYLPPPRLARGCDPCEWYLVTPRPSRLLRLDRCSGAWLPVWNERCDPNLLRDAVAVAAHGHRIAVADGAMGVLYVWAEEGGRLSAAIHLSKVVAIAISPRGEVFAALDGSPTILRYGPTGDEQGQLPAEIPLGAGVVDRLAVADDSAVWVVTRSDAGTLRLWKAAIEDRHFQGAGISDLGAAFRRTGLTAAAEGRGFCLEQTGPGGVLVERCFSWYGRPADPADMPHPPPPKRHTQGQLLTQAIDSGIPRCRWHRVRLMAEAPVGTSLTVAISTSETADPPPQGISDLQWSGFPVGKPHPADWQEFQAGALDVLVRQPPGRYLFLRARLTGDGEATPLLQAIHLDFPRVTSLELLPPVYRDNPDAEDFTERFLSLFDSAIADLDRAIERYPALLDPDGVPDPVLPWLGTFLDVTFDPLWDPERRRRILKAVPQLYRRRGTIAGLVQAFHLIFDVTPAIRELAAERSFGILGRDARLRSLRLFGKTRARVRLGSSQTSKAAIKSYGNPDHDPINAGACQFRVLLPPVPSQDATVRQHMEQLVEAQKPAHTVAQVRFGGKGLVLGQWSTIGVDTLFAPPPAPVLGKEGNIRLNGVSLLWPKRSGRRTAMALGRDSWVGLNTVVE